MTHTIYIDEAGNTGDDLIYGNQPFFTIAAIGVDDTITGSIQAEVRALRMKYRLPDTQELKASRLVGTRNEGILMDIFNILMEKTCLLFFTVVEKKFMIAGRIVEDLFDPGYNSKTNNSWALPGERKIDLANFLYENLSDQTIALSGTAFQKGELDQLQKAYESITAEVEGKAFTFDVSEILNGASLQIGQLSKNKLEAEEMFKTIFSSHSGVMNSPNLTTYFELLSRLEGFYRGTHVTSVDIIFDSARQFNAAFANLYKTISTAKPNILAFPHKTPLIFGFTHVKSFRDEDSKSNVLVQLADLLASSVNSLILKIARSNSSTAFSEFEVFMIIMVYQLIDDKFGDWIVSKRMKRKFGEVFITEGEKLRMQQAQSEEQ